MKTNKKDFTKHINALEILSLISTLLLIGVLLTIKVLFGDTFITISDYISFIAMVLLLGLLAAPIGGFIYWLIMIKYGMQNTNLYDIAYSDGERDLLEKQRRSSIK